MLRIIVAICAAIGGIILTAQLIITLTGHPADYGLVIIAALTLSSGAVHLHRTRKREPHA